MKRGIITTTAAQRDIGHNLFTGQQGLSRDVIDELSKETIQISLVCPSQPFFLQHQYGIKFEQSFYCYKVILNFVGCPNIKPPQKRIIISLLVVSVLTSCVVHHDFIWMQITNKTAQQEENRKQERNKSSIIIGNHYIIN